MPEFAGAPYQILYSSSIISNDEVQRLMSAYFDRAELPSPFMHPDVIFHRQSGLGGQGQVANNVIPNIGRMARGLAGEHIESKPEELALPPSDDRGFSEWGTRGFTTKKAEVREEQEQINADGTRDSEWEDAQAWAEKRGEVEIVDEKTSGERLGEPENTGLASETEPEAERVQRILEEQMEVEERRIDRQKKNEEMEEEQETRMKVKEEKKEKKRAAKEQKIRDKLKRLEEKQAKLAAYRDRLVQKGGDRKKMDGAEKVSGWLEQHKEELVTGAFKKEEQHGIINGEIVAGTEITNSVYDADDDDDENERQMANVESDAQYETANEGSPIETKLANGQQYGTIEDSHSPEPLTNGSRDRPQELTHQIDAKTETKEVTANGALTKEEKRAAKAKRKAERAERREARKKRKAAED